MTSTTLPLFGLLLGRRPTRKTRNTKAKKQRYFYARINAENVCTSVWSFDEPCQSDEVISIKSLDTTLIGKVWESGLWVRP
jgi:hypothetical protein